MITDNETFQELKRIYHRIDGLAVEKRASAYFELVSILIQELGGHANYSEVELFVDCLADQLKAFCDIWNLGD